VLAACLLGCCLLGGCSSARSATPPALRLERADLVQVARQLRAIAPAALGEAQATKAAWPHVANGLRAQLRPYGRALVAAAAARAAALRLPALFGEHEAAALTGPGAGLAGSFRGFSLLSTRGWQLIAAAVAQSLRPHSRAASFARTNVALYIESVYDAHYTLAQLGKQLQRAYEKLGGGEGFRSALAPREVAALAAQYSEANFRLHPHPGVKLGS